ncbi:aromatic/alkene monooxygenase hydroxylase subunit beta [Streptomyces ipomoeae]|uniref:aromatic/alkene monooxygenase hydroxylase subunit beta n=1 Tax=Streptomyces ipomoeae TaxID=103232 RepID=UPI001147A418|nr:aromatic/alkene monooxygenase hydroxylase subunit beta [Streptomyces ipomoeae]MDX2933436.1 aromatic/alkene monooxygenase hydroxylase subunit beta [Streptomyces ipomoeae]TQE20296.1 toluene hydroxylase [Streptomyces ipomoeae]
MTTQADKPVKAERSFPKPQFTDAEAGALVFPSSTSRTFSYYEPQKMRATMYEDVTFDVQPDPERHLTQGWIYGFADGSSGYPQDWTALKSSDWHRFLDPNEEWEQTIYRNNANVVRQVQQNLGNAKKAQAYGLWTRSWASFVERHVGAWMHAEQGLGMHVFVAIQRSAPTNMINNALAVNAAHKLRFAQDLALYNLDIEEQLDGFDGSAHKDVWQSDPAWQGVRENTERLTAVQDWAEALFATNLVFEPLVGELFRSHLVQQIAARNGDYTTPTVMGAGENDYDRDLRYTRELFALLLADLTHGAGNRELAQEWLERWAPVSLDAARRLQPLWSQPTEKPIRFEDSLDRAKERFGRLIEDLGLRTPADRITERTAK